MNKVKVLNVKTGKVSMLTKFAVDQLKKGGHFKQFEILEDKSTKAVKPIPVVNEEIVEQVYVDGDEASSDNDEEPKRTYRKRK
jgi:hypothetical protein